MKIKAGRILLVAIASEVLAVLTLVLIVALFGPSDPAEAPAYARRLGFWVGPIAGFGYTLIGAWWIARKLGELQILHGVLLGVAVAAIDVTLLVLGGGEFLPIFVASNIGRVVAGYIGGWIACQCSRTGD